MQGNRFAVRNLPVSGGSLDGIFRIHLLPEHLDQIGLKTGDLCAIVGEQGSGLHHGIAWRATDGMGRSPKAATVKMTEQMRLAYGIKENSLVSIAKTAETIVRAAKVTLVDVTPAEYQNTSSGGDPVEDERWQTRCSYALCSCEAVASGMTFDISAKRGVKRRYRVKRVEGATAQPNPPTLSCFVDTTQLEFESNDNVEPTAEQPSQSLLSSDYIGGLLSQIEELNILIKQVLRQPNDHRSAGRSSLVKNVLIHGPEGTGKTLILDRMRHCGFRKVVEVDASSAKSSTKIRELFQTARESQPSLILMDDLEELAPRSDAAYSKTICQELDSLKDLRVMAVGACRAQSDINRKIAAVGRLSISIELPVPDAAARKDILTVLTRHMLHIDSSTVEHVAARSHGFTANDLAQLVERAIYKAFLQREKLNNTLLDGSSGHAQAKGLINGTIKSGEAQVITHEPSCDDQSAEDSHTLTLADFEAAMKEVRPTALREICFEKPEIKWSDIGGSQEVQARFDKTIGWPLSHPEVLAQYSTQSDRGVLLYGPPGCSKTLTAQAVATTYGLNFILVKGAELISMYVGESERSIREVFRKARSAAPCVIFFDEIDSIASERESGSNKGLNVLTTLLNEMDGFEQLQGVFVLAATNKPEVLDPAIMRPGRFDSHIYLGLPNNAARREIFAINVKRIPRQGDLDTEALAGMTDGYTGAEIVRICKLAIFEAIERKINNEDGKVGMGDFAKALPQVKMAVTAEMLASYEAFSQAS